MPISSGVGNNGLTFSCGESKKLTPSGGWSLAVMLFFGQLADNLPGAVIRTFGNLATKLPNQLWARSGRRVHG